MPTVLDILRRKGAEIVSVPPTASVLEAAHLMNARRIGSVLVLDGPFLRGIFTERDVLRKIVAVQRDPATTPIADVMTTDVVTCAPDMTIEECMATMTRRRIRRLPVLAPDGTLAGVVTSGDVLASQVAEQAFELENLNTYIHGH